MTEAELLFTQIMQCDCVDLYLNRKKGLDKVKSVQIARALKRRIMGEPLEYILGTTEFMGLEFRVNPDVFIPRSETEILVETAIRLVKNFGFKNVNILDIGTGCGCIAISLAKYLPSVTVTATDISARAIEVAIQNSRMHNVNQKIKFLVTDLFDAHKPQIRNYDLIVSNPPYIASSEIPYLAREVLFQPRIALDGGKDGLYFYRKIINEVHHYLKENGYLILELGFNQRRAIEDIFIGSGNFEIIDLVRDYSGVERVIVTKRI